MRTRDESHGRKLLAQAPRLALLSGWGTNLVIFVHCPEQHTQADRDPFMGEATKVKSRTFQGL